MDNKRPFARCRASPKIAKQLNTSIEYLVTGKNEEKNGIKKNLQEMIPKLNHLSNENHELINLIAGRLK